MNSALEVHDVLQTMLDMVLEIFQADAGSVMLERDGFLTINVSRGLDPEIVEKTRQKLGTGIAGWVAATGEALHLDGKVEDPRFDMVVERGDSIASSLSVPISIEGSVAGVLMIRRVGERRFDPGDLAFLVSVGDLAAVALQKARLFQAERRQRRLLELGNQKLTATFSSMADGVVVLDQSHQVLSCNVVARRFMKPICSDSYEQLGATLAQMVERGQLEFNSGERVLKIVPTPLVVEGEESGSVLLLRDETASRELDRMKSEFLSMISHELKTPITTISAFLELLLHREFPRERLTHFLGICADESRRLQSLIDQLLNLTRLEAGRFVLEEQDLDFGKLVKDCIPAFAETNPDHEFLVQEPFPSPILRVDPTLISQAVTNLLSNAVKYSPGGGKVALSLKELPEAVVLSVKDEGVGIEAEKLALVFEKFFRADNSLTRATGGTGLGLANVKHIALAHGGSVWAESTPGSGSTFFLELPKQVGGKP
ncbi:MAG: GAF domain-containing sensor histidine kinase [Vulcanimicrobiota bacterium]